MSSPKKKKKNAGRARGGGRGDAAPKNRDAQAKAPGTRIANRKTDDAKLVGSDKLAATRAKERRKSTVRRALVAAAVVAAAAVFGYAIYRTQQPSDLPDPEAGPSSSEYAVPKNGDKAGVTVGNADAATTVDIYLDYMCMHCQQFEAVAGEYLAEQVRAGKIKIVYHPVTFLSGYSVWGSSAAGCAADEDKFMEFNREVFRDQDGDGLDRDALIEVGRRVGLTSKTFEECVKKDTYTDWALGLREPADKRGVRGTPTVMLNGEKFLSRERETNGQYLARLREAIAQAEKK